MTRADRAVHRCEVTPASRVSSARRWRACAGSATRFLLALTLTCAVAVAQDAPRDTSANGWAIGGTLMLPSGNESFAGDFTLLGMTAATVRPNQVGADMALVVAPRYLGAGAVLGGVRANAAVPLALGPNALIIPSAGLSLFGAFAAGGAGGARGVNGTLALLMFSRPAEQGAGTIALRVAASIHRFAAAEGGTIRMLEIGIVKLPH